jgi:hypothetical protein
MTSPETPDDALPPPASSGLTFLVAIGLLAVALVQIVLLRGGLSWSAPASLALASAQAILVGALMIPIRRRPFVLFLWVVTVLFVAVFIGMIAADLAAHFGPPVWAR